MTDTPGHAPDILLREFLDSNDRDPIAGASREQLESALRHMEEALTGFRVLAEATMAGLYILQDGAFQYVNPAFVELFGYTVREQVEGQKPEKFVHPEDQAKVKEFIRRRIEGEEEFAHYTFRGLRADGTEILVEVMGRAVELRERRAIVGTVFDITERERANEAVIQSEALFRAVSEKSPNMIFIVQDDSIVYCNRACSEITGFPVRQLTHPDFSFYELPAPDSQDKLRSLVEQQLQGKEAAPLSYKMLTADGRTIEVSQNTRLINFQGDLAVLAIVTDVTDRNQARRERERLLKEARRELAERRQAEEALRASEERYRAVAESAFTGVGIVDEEERFSYANPALAEMLGTAPEYLIGTSLAEYLDEEQFSKVQEQSKLRKGGERGQYELLLRPLRGDPRQVLVSAAPITDSSGNFAGSLAVVTDITELKETQDALAVAIVRMEDALDRTRELAKTEEALRDTAAALNSTLNTEELLDRILENLSKVLPYDTADIMLIYESQSKAELLRPVRWRGYDDRGLDGWIAALELPVSEVHNFARMKRSGKPVTVPDTRADRNWVEFPEVGWIRSYTGAPIRESGKVIGILNLNSELPGFYEPLQAVRLQAFADQAAAAIHNAKLYTQIKEELAERRRAEVALRESERRYRAVFDGVTDAILVESLAGEILDANESACQIYGWSREQLIGMHVSDLVPEADQIVLPAADDPESLPAEAVEVLNRRADGEVFPVELTARLHSVGGDQVILAVLRDIAARKQIETAERELTQLKVQFILSASHSLKTPLHTLMGFLELLTSGRVRDEATRADFLRRASDDAARISHVIGDLLDTAKIEIGEQGLQLERLAVMDLFADVVDRCGPLSLQHQVELEVQQPPEQLVVQADRRRFGLALEALVDNAIKYSQSEAQVELRALEHSGEVLIQVIDGGPGIPDSDLSILLGRPVGAEAPNINHISGTGLGLYLANNLIKAHGGALEAESEVGVGSTFTIRMSVA